MAAAALMGRDWGMSTRHHSSLALAGGLFRAGWSVADAVAMVEAVCAAAGDEECRDRVRAVQDTADRIKAGGEATGWPSLAKLLGKDGEVVVRTVREWLGVRALFNKSVSHAGVSAGVSQETDFPAGGKKNSDPDDTAPEVNETKDDPHRLAGGFLASVADDDVHLLRHWRDDFHEWKAGAYHHVPDGDVRGRVVSWVRSEFLRLNAVELAVWNNRAIEEDSEKQDAKSPPSGR